MKAALTYGPFDTRVEEVPEPTPGPGEVKVKIAYCGICGSDPEIYEGTFGLLKAPWWPKASVPDGTRGLRRDRRARPRSAGRLRRSVSGWP